MTKKRGFHHIHSNPILANLIVFDTNDRLKELDETEMMQIYYVHICDVGDVELSRI